MRSIDVVLREISAAVSQGKMGRMPDKAAGGDSKEGAPKKHRGRSKRSQFRAEGTDSKAPESNTPESNTPENNAPVSNAPEGEGEAASTAEVTS